MVTCPSFSSALQLRTAWRAVRCVRWARKHHRQYQQVMTPVNATTTDLNHLAVVLAPKNPVKSRSSMCGGGFQCFLWYNFKSSRLHQQCYHWTCAACFPWRGRTTCPHKADWVEGANGQLLPECVPKNESSSSHCNCRAGLEATMRQEYQTFRVKGSSHSMNAKSLGW